MVFTPVLVVAISVAKAEEPSFMTFSRPLCPTKAPFKIETRSAVPVEHENCSLVWSVTVQLWPSITVLIWPELNPWPLNVRFYFPVKYPLFELTLWMTGTDFKPWLEGCYWA
jgi:hypothetical protein